MFQSRRRSCSTLRAQCPPGLVRKSVLDGTVAIAGPGMEAGMTDEDVQIHVFG
jgi:hypothetical protein